MGCQILQNAYNPLNIMECFFKTAYDIPIPPI